MQIEIKRVGVQDVDRLQAISRRTFSETFAADNTAADMEQYLNEGFGRDRLLAELRNEGSRSYFAELDGQVIGYLKVNTGGAQTEPIGDKALEIERIYVLKEFHGRHVGQLLYDQAIAVAKELNVDQVWLGVWEKNPRAIHFYRKNGFVEFGKHLFQLGTDEQTDILMRRSLKDRPVGTDR